MRILHRNSKLLRVANLNFKYLTKNPNNLSLLNLLVKKVEKKKVIVHKKNVIKEKNQQSKTTLFLI